MRGSPHPSRLHPLSGVSGVSGISGRSAPPAFRPLSRLVASAVLRCFACFAVSRDTDRQRYIALRCCGCFAFVRSQGERSGLKSSPESSQVRRADRRPIKTPLNQRFRRFTLRLQTRSSPPAQRVVAKGELRAVTVPISFNPPITRAHSSTAHAAMTISPHSRMVRCICVKPSVAIGPLPMTA
jgi:hypothetical protein